MSTLTLRGRAAPWAALVIGLLMAPPALAADDDVLVVEEHWELSIGDSDAARCAPQASLIMSPTNHLNGSYFVLAINHWSHPDFSPGGVQVQHWWGNNCVSAAPGLNVFPVAIDGEVLTWTQRMTLDQDADTVTFEVLDGDSQSWGAFGGAGQLKATVPTSYYRLNSYRASISLGESGIGFAGNRVSSLTLQKIRWQTADGEWHEQLQPFDIDSGLDP